MWGQLLSTRYNLRGVAIYSRRLHVSPIQWHGADLTADILPRVLEREQFPFSPLLYKALRRRVLLFVHQHIRSLKNSGELQCPDLRIYVTISVRRPSLKRFLEIVAGTPVSSTRFVASNFSSAINFHFGFLFVLPV